MITMQSSSRTPTSWSASRGRSTSTTPGHSRSLSQVQTQTSGSASRGKPTTTTPGHSRSLSHVRTSRGSKNTSTTRSGMTRVSSNHDPQHILAIAVGRGQASGEVGIACVGLNAPNLILSQFIDNSNYLKTLTKINIFQPLKVLMTAGLCVVGQKSRLYEQIEKEFPRVEIVPIQRRHYNNAKGLRRIQMLVNEELSPLPPTIISQYYTLAASAALLKYVELIHGVMYAPKTLRVEFQVSEKTTLIDSSTAKHLELITANTTNGKEHENTLFGILSNCKTPTGSRFLRSNILQPPCDLRLITHRLDCVEELINKPELLYGVQANLSRLPVDLENVISSLIRIPHSENAKVLEQRAALVVALKHTLEVIPSFQRALQDAEHPYFCHLRSQFQLPVFEYLVRKIHSVINEEAHLQKGVAGMRTQRTFAIKAETNAFLDVARRVYCEIMDDINEYVLKLSRENGLPLQLSQSPTRGFFIQFKVSDNDVVAQPNLPNTFLQVQRQRNTISFTTEVLLVSNGRVREVLKEIDYFSDIIIAQLVADIREKIGALYKISDAIANLDLLHSFAVYALGNQVVRPQFSTIVTSITKGRHPILDQISLQPVPNNIFLSCDVNVNIITGPNMSGKTTYLKQAATLQVMGQIGSFVPAKAATFRIANGIFSRLGTEDNIEANASTFAVEMSEMSFILKNSSSGTPLIIIDELGRATSVDEGTALSWACLEAFIKTKAFVLFATHFLYLTKLESLHLNVLNYNMETREVLSSASNIRGIGDVFRLHYSHVSSRGVTQVEHYGLQLARNSSLPNQVVNRGLEIADAIISSRQTQSVREDAEMRRKRSLYLLGSQLALASELLKDCTSEVKIAYLRGLKQQFSNNRF